MSSQKERMDLFMKQNRHNLRNGIAIMLIVLLLCGLTACGTGAVTYFIQDDTPKAPVSYSQYKMYGLQYDESKNKLYFDGELIRIERYSPEEFDNRDLSNFYGSSDAVTYCLGSYDPSAESFTDLFAKYKGFGIEYVESATASGAGNVYYNGQLVNSFADISPNGEAFTFHSADSGNINVQIIYGMDGNLTGVELLR